MPCGALAQLGERLICIQEVIGSIPIGSTNTECEHSVSARQLLLAIACGTTDEVEAGLNRLGR